MLICGIDPGLSGAIGFVHGDGSFAGVHDMPTLPSSTGRRTIDAAALASLLRDRAPAFAMVERVGARPREGAVGAFSFGHTYGAILGVLAALGIPHAIIQPAVWKRAAGIPSGADKRVSISVAKQMIPGAAPHLTRIKDDGRAEALLLAMQSRMKQPNAASSACSTNQENTKWQLQN